MTLDIVPFADLHIEPAAQLLAEQFRGAREIEPSLAQRFEEPEQARKPLEFVWKLPMSGGAVALIGERVAGFMLGLAFPEDISHYALAPFSAVSHALDKRADVLRAMYAQLADEWVEAGCIGHYPSVPVSEPELIDAWFSLGFGQDNVVGTRSTAASAERPLPAGIVVRRAGAEDEESIQRLYDGLEEHLERSPAFHARRPEVRRERKELRERITRDGPGVYLVAARGDRVMGVQNWDRTRKGHPYVPEDCIELQHAFVAEEERRKGVGRALFNAGLAWAREGGYERCVVDWEPANLGGNRFWRGHGFRPLSYLLGRRIERR